MSDPKGQDDDATATPGPSSPSIATDRPRKKRSRTLARHAADRPRKKRRKRKSKKRPSSVAATQNAARARPQRGRGRDRHHVLFAAGGLLAVLATATILLVFGYARISGPSGTAVEIDWPAGLDPEQSAAILAEKGLVHSASAMALYLRATGGTADFVAGPHLLYQGASPHELRAMLSRSPSRPTVRVVIPEGFHRFDIADRLQKQHITGQRQFLAATSDRALLVELGIDTTANRAPRPVPNQERTTDPPESAEGYLFPATYEFQVDTDAREITKRLVSEFEKKWSALVAQRAQGFASVSTTLGWGRREVITLASIIQREAMVDEERPVIASVFYNRLLDPTFRPRRRLQSDPTAMYGCVAHPEEAPTCADYKGKPTSAILHDPKNRYTTYMAPGLPPGPISNPGAASLEAVLAPASTKYLFFVAKGGGRHTFSETFDAHNNAVQQRRDDN